MTFQFEQKPCALCNGTNRVEVIPHGYGANDSQEDECPWCMRRKWESEREHMTAFGITWEIEEALKVSVKWLERISNRKEMLPASFMDNCDPTPMAKRIRKILSKINSGKAD